MRARPTAGGRSAPRPYTTVASQIPKHLASAGRGFTCRHAPRVVVLLIGMLLTATYIYLQWKHYNNQPPVSWSSASVHDASIDDRGIIFRDPRSPSAQALSIVFDRKQIKQASMGGGSIDSSLLGLPGRLPSNHRSAIAVARLVDTVTEYLGTTRFPHAFPLSSREVRRPLRIFESGCELKGVTGPEILLHPSIPYGSTFIGQNCAQDGKPFPAEQLHISNVLPGRTLFFGNPGCGELPLQDNLFDVVFSSNIMEHARPLDEYIHELHRILRPGGIAHIEWWPVWYGPTGHHVHEDMVEWWVKSMCPDGVGIPAYRNDGRSIPYFGHLTQSREELRSTLKSLPQSVFGCDQVIERVLEFIYDDQDVNRATYETAEAAVLGRSDFSLEENRKSKESPLWDVLDATNWCQDWRSRWGQPLSDHSKRMIEKVHDLPRGTRFDLGWCLFVLRKK